MQKAIVYLAHFLIKIFHQVEGLGWRFEQKDYFGWNCLSPSSTIDWDDNAINFQNIWSRAFISNWTRGVGLCRIGMSKGSFTLRANTKYVAAFLAMVPKNSIYLSTPTYCVFVRSVNQAWARWKPTIFFQKATAVVPRQDGDGRECRHHRNSLHRDDWSPSGFREEGHHVQAGAE